MIESRKIEFPGATGGNLAARLVRLPLFPCMGDALSRVIERVQTHLDRLL